MIQIYCYELISITQPKRHVDILTPKISKCDLTEKITVIADVLSEDVIRIGPYSDMTGILIRRWSCEGTEIQG